VVTAWTGKPLRSITNSKVNSAFHPSGVGNQVLAGVKAKCIHLHRVADMCDHIRQVMLRSSAMGFPQIAIQYT